MNFYNSFKYLISVYIILNASGFPQLIHYPSLARIKLFIDAPLSLDKITCHMQRPTQTGCWKHRPLITRISNFKWTSFRLFTAIAILTIATILYLSLSSRTGNLKCGRFINTRTIRGDENQERDVRNSDSRASTTTRNRSIEWKRRRQAPWSHRLWFMTSRDLIRDRRCRSGYGRTHVRNDIRRDTSLLHSWKGTLRYTRENTLIPRRTLVRTRKARI